MYLNIHTDTTLTPHTYIPTHRVKTNSNNKNKNKKYQVKNITVYQGTTEARRNYIPGYRRKERNLVVIIK